MLKNNEAKIETWTATGIDANMPTYRMLLTLVGYIFAPATVPGSCEGPPVHRPRISRSRAAFIVGMHLCLGLAIGYAAAIVLDLHPAHSPAYAIAVTYLLVTATVQRTRIVIWLIRLYQARAPEEIRAKCVMTPRCSDYMTAAIVKYGLFAGVSKGVARLRRCGPPARNDYP